MFDIKTIAHGIALKHNPTIKPCSIVRLLFVAQANGVISDMNVATSTPGCSFSL